MPKDLKIKASSMYDQFDFPDYEFAEFPMAVPVNEAGEVQKTPYREPTKSGKIETWPVVHVKDQAELSALLSGAAVIPASGAARVESEEDVKDRLVLRAGQVGAKVDRKWTPERMEAAIEAVEGKAEA